MSQAQQTAQKAREEALREAAEARRKRDQATSQKERNYWAKRNQEYSGLARRLERDVNKRSVAFYTPKGTISNLAPGSERYVKAVREGWVPLNRDQIREVREKRREWEKAHPQMIIPEQTASQRGEVLYKVKPGEEPQTYIQTFDEYEDTSTPMKVPPQTIRQRGETIQTIEPGEKPGTYVQTIYSYPEQAPEQRETIEGGRAEWVTPSIIAPEAEQYLDAVGDIGEQIGKEALRKIGEARPEAYSGFTQAQRERAAEEYERIMAEPTQRILKTRRQLMIEAAEAKMEGKDILAGAKYAEAVALGPVAYFREAITMPVRPYKLPWMVRDVGKNLLEPEEFKRNLEAFEKDPLLLYGGLPAAYLGGKAVGELGGALSKEIGLEKAEFKGFDTKTAEEAVASKWTAGKWPSAAYDKKLYGAEGILSELIHDRPQATVYVPRFEQPLTVQRAFELTGTIGGLQAPISRADASLKRIPSIEPVSTTHKIVRPVQIDDLATRNVIRNVQRLRLRPEIIPVEEQRKRRRAALVPRQEIIPVIGTEQTQRQEQAQAQADAQLTMLTQTLVTGQRRKPRLRLEDEEKRKRRKGKRAKRKGVFELRAEFEEPKEPEIKGFELPGEKKKKGKRLRLF